MTIDIRKELEALRDEFLYECKDVAPLNGRWNESYQWEHGYHEACRICANKMHSLIDRIPEGWELRPRYRLDSSGYEKR